MSLGLHAISFEHAHVGQVVVRFRRLVRTRAHRARVVPGGQGESKLFEGGFVFPELPQQQPELSVFAGEVESVLPAVGIILHQLLIPIEYLRGGLLGLLAPAEDGKGVCHVEAGIDGMNATLELIVFATGQKRRRC